MSTRHPIPRAPAHGSFRRFAPGATIIRQGELGRSAFYILRGQVRVTFDELDQHDVARLGPGEVFGEMTALLGGRRSATVVAVVETLALELGPVALREAFRRDPGLREAWSRLGLHRAELGLRALVDAA